VLGTVGNGIVGIELVGTKELLDDREVTGGLCDIESGEGTLEYWSVGTDGAGGEMEGGTLDPDVVTGRLPYGTEVSGSGTEDVG
jgi:hypothetical protein